MARLSVQGEDCARKASAEVLPAAYESSPRETIGIEQSMDLRAERDECLLSDTQEKK